ncbi:MAG: response regulator [Verrucomicrobiia bacterium]
MGSNPAARTTYHLSNIATTMEQTQNLTQATRKSEEKDSKKVLILDDDQWFTNLLTELLQTQNFQITTVENGVEGLKEIMKTDYDVILCDIMMPNLSGDMFYVAVQRTKPHLCKRFIFMSGHKGNPKIEEFIKNVSGIMLWKPFELYQLLKAIKALEVKSREN